MSWTRERARVAALTRHEADPADVEAARRDLRAAKLEDHVLQVLAAAPPLTDEQRHKLAALLHPLEAGHA